MGHKLEQIVAAPTPTGIRSISRVQRILPKLNLGQLGSIYRRAEAGDVKDLQSLAIQTLRRDPHMASQLQTRRMSAIQAPWAVIPSEVNPSAVEHAEMIQRVMALPTWTNLLYTMSDGVYMQYSVSEVIWAEQEGRLVPVRFEERDPRFFMYHRDTGELVLRDDGGDPDGIPLDDGKFLVHRAPSVAGRPQLAGLLFVLTLWNLYKDLSTRNWLALSEVWGIPVRVARYDMQATKTDIETLHQAIRDLATDAGCVIPMGVELEVFNSGSGATAGSEMFSDLLHYCDEAVSKAILGGTLNSDVGGSEAQAVVHERLRFDVLRGDVDMMGDSLDDQLVRVIIDVNFGPQPAGTYPSVKASPRLAEDLPQITEMITALNAAGVPLKLSEIYARTGFSPVDGEPEENILPGAIQMDPNAQADASTSSDDGPDQ